MGEHHALEPLPQRTLDGWHRFVATADRDLLASLLSEHIVFRSPFLQSPIPGRTATPLVLTTVIQIFENLVKFNEAGEMIEFEVMIRPIKALQALGEEMGNRIGPQLARLKEAAGAQP